MGGSMKMLKRLFCRHDWVFERNIYGDEINALSGRRSWWVCRKCGKHQARPNLVRDEKGRTV